MKKLILPLLLAVLILNPNLPIDHPEFDCNPNEGWGYCGKEGCECLLGWPEDGQNDPWGED